MAAKRPSKWARKRWINRIFSAKSARTGGIVYRGVDQVNQWASLKELRDAVLERNFHMLRVGELYVIVCQHPADIKVVC